MYALSHLGFDCTYFSELYKIVLRKLDDAGVRRTYYDSLSKYCQQHYIDELQSRSSYLTKGLIISVGINMLLISVFYVLHRSNNREQGEVLTNKENEVMELIVERKSNKEISTILFISDATVKTHINKAATQVGVSLT